MSTTRLFALTAATATAAAVGCGAPAPAPADPSAAGSRPLQIVVPLPDYDRELHFGGWTSRGGCDTRARELHAASGPRAVDGPDRDTCLDDGPVRDAWTGQWITPAEAQIDHVVPLSLMWVGGAYTWTRPERVAAANDPDNLVVTATVINRDEKNDLGPDRWRPPDPSAWCDYRHAWESTVARYHLQWPPDRAAAYQAGLDDMCPDGAR